MFKLRPAGLTKKPLQGLSLKISGIKIFGRNVTIFLPTGELCYIVDTQKGRPWIYTLLPYHKINGNASKWNEYEQTMNIHSNKKLTDICHISFRLPIYISLFWIIIFWWLQFRILLIKFNVGNICKCLMLKLKIIIIIAWKQIMILNLS